MAFNIGLEPEGQMKLKCVKCGFLSLYCPLKCIHINHNSQYSLIIPLVLIVQAHPWFKDIAWDRLYETEAAFKPQVNGELDTQNFMKFDEV